MHARYEADLLRSTVKTITGLKHGLELKSPHTTLLTFRGAARRDACDYNVAEPDLVRFENEQSGSPCCCSETFETAEARLEVETLRLPTIRAVQSPTERT